MVPVPCPHVPRFEQNSHTSLSCSLAGARARARSLGINGARAQSSGVSGAGNKSGDSSLFAACGAHAFVCGERSLEEWGTHHAQARAGLHLMIPG